MNSFTEAAERGAALLDEHQNNWWANIDLDTLDLADPDRCVLGQVFESYTDGLVELFGSPDTDGFVVQDHGFDFVSPDPDFYDYLTAAWVSLIDERHAALV